MKTHYYKTNEYNDIYFFRQGAEWGRRLFIRDNTTDEIHGKLNAPHFWKEEEMNVPRTNYWHRISRDQARKIAGARLFRVITLASMDIR